MADQLIPLTTDKQQTFAISVNVDSQVKQLRLVINYNALAGYWTMDVADSAGIPILASVPLITGDWPASNLLEQYQHLGIGSAYMINAGTSSLDYPDGDSLGSDFVLQWSDAA